MLTGGTGAIGQLLVRRLAQLKHDLIVLSRSKTDPRLSDDVEIHQWDPLTEIAPADALTDADVVIHLAGERIAGLWTASKRTKVLNSRIMGTRNLVDGMKRASPPGVTLISASAVGYYGDRDEERLTETANPGEGFLAKVAMDWETESIHAESFGARVVRMRMGVVLAPESITVKLLRLAWSLCLGARLGNGRQWWTWVHADDVVSAYIEAIHNSGLAGPVNLVGPEPVRQAEFAKSLGLAMGRPAFLWVPEFPIKVAMREMAEELLGSKLVIPSVLNSAGFQFQYKTLREALASIL